MRKTFRQSALALMLLGGAVLATAPAFAGYRHIYVGPPAVVAPSPACGSGPACGSRRALCA